MYWTLELASSLDDAPWPATKEELIDYATRTCAPDEVVENLEELEDDGEIYENPSKTSGPIIPRRMIFSLTRKSIKR